MNSMLWYNQTNAIANNQRSVSPQNQLREVLKAAKADKLLEEQQKRCEPKTS